MLFIVHAPLPGNGPSALISGGGGEGGGGGNSACQLYTSLPPYITVDT